MFNEEKIKIFFSGLVKKISNFKIWNIINVPNSLSFIRIILIIPFSMNILKENYLKATEIFIFSGVTDFFDGFFARVLNQQTKFGEIIDPIADKLTLVSIMVCIGMKFPSVVPFMMALIIKEMFMLLAGAFMLKRCKKTIKAKWYGKLGTVFFYFSVTIIVMVKALWGIENKFLIDNLMLATALLMFHALIRYSIEFISIISDKSSRSK